MNITQVETATDSDPQPAEGAWDILTPVGEQPLRVFQQQLLLRFSADTAADRIAVDAASTALQGEFDVFDYDARKDDIPHLQAALSSGPSNSVIVELDAPREIVRIGFGFNSLSTPAIRVALHRLDGDQLSEKPTVEVPLGAITSIVADKISGGGVFAFSRAAQPSGGISGEKLHSAGGSVSISGFTDARFAIVLRNATGTEPLAVTQLTKVIVRSRPAAPRFGLPDPRQPEKVLFFWPTPEEVDQSARSDTIDVDASAPFAAQLQRFLDEANSAPGEAIEVPITVESDAPCRLDISNFNVGFQYAIESFADKSMDKQVLRFSGQQAVTRDIEIRLPGDAQVTEATIRTAESFRGDRPVLNAETDPAGSAGPSNQGVYFAVGRSVAQQFVPDSAVSASGIALLIVALAENMQIEVQLQSDSADQPSGKVLAHGTVGLVKAGRPTWTTVAFPDPVVVSGEPHWLVIRPAAGSGMWVADQTDSNRLVRADSDGTWTELTALSGLLAKQTLLSRVASLSNQIPFALTSDGTDVSPLAAQAGDPPGTRLFELAPALNQRLAQAANGEAAVNIRLIATSAIAGTLTVYRPHIKYNASS